MDLAGKRALRLRVMAQLYQQTDGSKTIYIDLMPFAATLGCEPVDLTSAIEYLAGEELITETAGRVAITHQGAKQVEFSLHRPGEESEYFPPAQSVIQVGTMVGSVIQQSSPGATQNVEILSRTSVAQLQELVAELRGTVVPVLDLPDEDRSELESELFSAGIQLASSRPKADQIRSNLGRVGQLLSGATVTAGTTVQLAEYIQRVHELLPGV